MHASKSKMDTEFKAETNHQSHHGMPEMHYHDFYEIYIQDQGGRDHIISNTFYKLNPHDVVLLKPHILHQSISYEDHTRSLVYFTEDFLRSFFTTSTVQELLAPFRYNYLSLSSEIYYQITALVKDLCKEDRYAPSPFAYLKVAEILSLLKKNIQFYPPATPERRVLNSSPQENNQVSPLISYIHENFLTLTSIDEIAATFYITPSHLCRTFKKLTGYTIIQYINMLKIQKACDLLHDTTKNSTEIALDCGFNSTMYFCKTFKSILGMTPSEYRSM